MKSICTILSLMMITMFSSFAQVGIQSPKLPMDESTKLFSYTDVVEVPTLKKLDLYNKGLEWCNKYFKNPNDVIRERDSIEGNIICKARFKISNPVDKKGISTDGGVVQYTLKMMFKDGKFKYTITEFNWKQASYFPAEKWTDKTNAYYKPEYDFYLQQLNEKAREISKELEKSMKSVSTEKKNDW